MATEQPLHSEPPPFPWAVLLDGFQPIGTTGGSESAAGTDQRGDEAAIQADQRQHQPSHRAVQDAESFRARVSR